MAPPKRSKETKTKVSSTCPASRSRSTPTAAPAADDDVMNNPAVRDVTPPSAASSASSSTGKAGINGAEPAKKRRNRRRRNKRGSGSGSPPPSSSTGTQLANEINSAAAGGTPSASSSPPPSPGRGINPVKENSAAGRRPHPAGAAAAGSSASAAAINGGDPPAARSSPTKNKAGGKGGVTSPASSPPVWTIKDPSVVLAARSTKKPAVGGGTVQLTIRTTTSRTEVVQVEHHSYSTLSTSSYIHGSGKQLKAADASATSSASASSGTTTTLPDSDHAVSKIGGTEAIIVHSELDEYLPPSVDSELQHQFLKFLKEYTNPGEQYPFYKAQVVSLSKRKCYTLKVNFEHLKSSFFKNTTEYRDLVFKIVNNRDSTQSWLRKVVFVFLKNEGFDADEKTIDSNAKVDFINKPESITMLDDALKDKWAVVRKLDVLKNEVTMNAPTAYGRSTFRVVLSEILNRHRKGESYYGKFQVRNIVIVNSELCWILMEPSPIIKSPRASIQSDLTQLWEIMEKYYINEGYLPLYFEELRNDLVNQQLFDVTKELFRLYIEYHPALMPSRGRHEMIIGLNSAIQDHRSLMDEAFTTFLNKEPFESKDWRDKIKKGQSKIMERVYTFGSIGLKQDPLAKTGFSEDYFANTWEGLLGYIRNFLVHANNTAKIVDTDEIELFAASKFPTLLPRLLKAVSSNCNIQPYFRGVFSSYRTSRSNPKDLPS